MSNKNDSRYPASSHMTIQVCSSCGVLVRSSEICYMQRPYGQERRRTPSPVPPPPATYASYDRYVPPRGNTFYREPLQNSYRPDTWHTERQYSGPPSPDRYRMPRSTDGDSWGRQPWRPIEQLSWTERRNASDPYDSSWGRPRRDIMAQPMFEPSDNWKQFHGDGPEAQERYVRRLDVCISTSYIHSDGREWSYDRYPPEPPRDLRNRSPERQSLREHYPPAFVPNDRFRRLSGPSEQREAHPYGPRSDSYRPQYEERGSWGVSSYHPGNIEPRIREQRPPVRASRFIPRQEPIGERLWIPREASVSGESVQNSPVSSPIRTRTNLPDRLPLSHSRSGSGSYLHSPVNKPSPRPSWDLQSPTLPKRSLSSPQSLPEARYPSETLPYVPDHDEENVPLANEHSTHPSSHPPSPKLTPLASRSLLSPRIDQQGFVQHPSVAFDHHPSSPGPRSAQSLRVNDHKDQKPLPSPSESLLGSHPASIPSSPHQSHQGCTENDPSRPQPVFDNHGSIVSNNRDEEAFMDVDEEPMSPQLAPVMLIDSRDESSPEPDIPLAALTRHATTSRASVSEPSTPMLNLSEPPSRDEPTLRPQHWLAPNIQPTNEPTPLHKILRAVVMVRLQRDRQTSEERVNPVLLDNLSKVEPPSMPHVTTPEDIVREITAGVRQKALQESYVNARESLQARFARRQTDLSVKVANLREEYMGLHLQWAVHCGKLDEVAKALALQEAAATAGRTTRRSLATMGDAVRSDLEMEQIIASLGNEEMTDANHLGAKNAAVIPDMISVTEGEVDHLYDDTNNEVENPAKYYAPQTGIADWTEEEVNIFLDKFGEFPKQFGIIADFLPHKSPSQCVTFYYLHKNKHINFKEVVARRVTKRKRGGRKQKSNALLADIRKRDDEVSASGPGRRRRAPAPSLPNLETRKGSGRRVAVVAQADQTPNGTPTPEPDAEPRKRKRRIIARAVATEQEDGTEELVNSNLDNVTYFRLTHFSRMWILGPNVFGSLVSQLFLLRLARSLLSRPLFCLIYRTPTQWKTSCRPRSSLLKQVRLCRESHPV